MTSDTSPRDGSDRDSGGTTHEQLMEEYGASKYGDMPAWGARKSSLEQLPWRVLKRLAQEIDIFLQSHSQRDLARILAKRGYYYRSENNPTLYQYDEKSGSTKVSSLTKHVKA